MELPAKIKTGNDQNHGSMVYAGLIMENLVVINYTVLSLAKYQFKYNY